MTKILLISSVYRIGERIYSIIPKLSLFTEIDILYINEMSSEMKWYGDIDPRISFFEKYNKYISNSFDVGYDGFKKAPLIDTSNYDLVLYDDDRVRYGLELLYAKTDCPVIGCIHGCGIGYGADRYDKGKNIIFDYLFVFGNKDLQLHDDLIKIGIPSNDVLKNYPKTGEYILCIINFLGNFSSYDKCPVRVDKSYIEQSGILELQNEFQKEVIFKLKSRHALPDYKRDIQYLQSIIPTELKYKIIVDFEDNNKLIAQSFIVISSASTLAFKSIQLGIPTILIKDSGITGHFYDFKGLVPLETQIIFDELERQHNTGKETNFIADTIEGGIDFTATDICIKKIKRILA